MSFHMITVARKGHSKRAGMSSRRLFRAERRASSDMKSKALRDLILSTAIIGLISVTVIGGLSVVSVI